MKKIILITAITSSIALAGPFNGFGGGLSIGGIFTNYKMKSKGNKIVEYSPLAFITRSDVNVRKKEILLLSACAHYTKSFNQIIAGLDTGIGYEYGGIVKASDTETEVYPGGKHLLISNDHFKKMNNLFIFVQPRVGYKINPTTALYISTKVALKNYRFEDKTRDCLKKISMAYTVGVGIEKYVNDNVSFRTDVGYMRETISLKGGSYPANVWKGLINNAVVVNAAVHYTF